MKRNFTPGKYEYQGERDEGGKEGRREGGRKDRRKTIKIASRKFRYLNSAFPNSFFNKFKRSSKQIRVLYKSRTQS